MVAITPARVPQPPFFRGYDSTQHVHIMEEF